MENRTNKILEFLRTLKIIKLKAEQDAPDFVVICPKCKRYRQEGIGQIWVTTSWKKKNPEQVEMESNWIQEDAVIYKCNFCGYSKEILMPQYG